MHNIAERDVLVSARVEVPAGLKLATREFREGWNFMAGDASQFEKKIRRRGWGLIKIADGTLRSGVGETSQEAIASALKLAVRSVSEHFNAVEVEHIELTQYPWFFLARIRIYSYRIQQSAALPVPDQATAVPIASLQRRLQLRSAAMHPDLVSAVLQVKRMLILSGASQARLQ